MARKRLPEHDYICRRCECVCTPPWVRPLKHEGGGPGMKACKKEPVPVLRGEYEKEMDELAQGAIEALRNRITSNSNPSIPRRPDQT